MMSSDIGRGSRRGREVVLWIIAFVLVVGAAGYQRFTGPSYPARGTFEVAGQGYDYRLIRNTLTSGDARVAIPNPGVPGALHYKRYRTDDDFTSAPLQAEGRELVGYLPVQPPAGKLEYFLTLRPADGVMRVPGEAEGNVIIRFKDPVPWYSLVPHISMMFLALLVGMRAGLAALIAPGPMRRLAWTTLVIMTIGGMILGPIAQWYAFGAFWTGWPFDYDLTDNKVLIMWLVWIVGCGVLWLRTRKDERVSRAVVAIAALVMVVVYLIPHSTRGTEVDYELLDQGVPASEALRSGRPGQ
ncbi:MAG: hypothetical protein JSW46_01610 [Gemmatimonadota bacterium]|nr:MAG: hypothetical protein JSW46_01610 [Gemmatimonadota bacterium]